ncbi:cell division protein FtsQ/DivIB [Kineococcus sp. SYSU DK001]|uniref:cell division protein FtsQ/DivIB n=1 Tax=Kineococcus sp. SYSU DK001 TaxID=3383122 RepID=UPI003D7F0BB6
MASRPTRPRQPPSVPPEPEAKVAGTPQRRRALRAAGTSTTVSRASSTPARPAPRRAAPSRTAPPKAAERSRTRTRADVADLAGARKARRWRPGRRALGVLAGLVVLAVAVGWLLLASPWLRVETIRTTGLVRTDPAAVASILDRARGTALAGVNTRSLSRTVEDLPLVERVDITRSWPSTLVVTVHERQAVAAVPSTAGGVDLVDGEGNVLVHEADAPAGVPTLEVDVAAAGSDALTTAIAVNATLSNELRSRVSSISATGPDAVTLHVEGGPQVFWGDDGRPERKSEVLLRLLAEDAVAGARSVDVSAPDAPAVTP